MNEDEACDTTHYLKQGSSIPVKEDLCPIEFSFIPNEKYPKSFTTTCK